MDLGEDELAKRDGDFRRGEGSAKGCHGARARGLIGHARAWFVGVWLWMLQGVVRVSERGAEKRLSLAMLLIAVLTFALGLFVGLTVGFGAS